MIQSNPNPNRNLNPNPNPNPKLYPYPNPSPYSQAERLKLRMLHSQLGQQQQQLLQQQPMIGLQNMNGTWGNNNNHNTNSNPWVNHQGSPLTHAQILLQLQQAQTERTQQEKKLLVDRQHMEIQSRLWSQLNNTQLKNNSTQLHGATIQG